MIELMRTLGYINAFACLLFAVHLLRATPANPLPSRLLGVCFLMFSAQSFMLDPVLANGLVGFASVLRPMLALVINPALLLYFSAAAEPAFCLRPKQALHLLPALIAGIEILSQWFLIDIDLMIIVSMAVHALMLARQARSGSKQFSHLKENALMTQRLLIAAAIMLAFSAFVETFIVIEILNGRALSQSNSLIAALVMNLIVVGFVIVAAMQRPSPFDWLYAYGSNRATRALEKQIEADYGASVRAFDALMASEAWQTEENPTLAKAAQSIGVPARQLSEAINQLYCESFSRYVNRKRVTAAKHLIEQQPSLSMTNVMFDVGFHTKSSFNKEFRAITGLSPTEFRKQLMGDK